MLTFSQRQGLKPVRTVMQMDSIDDALRVKLWNSLTIYFWQEVPAIITNSADAELMLKRVWMHHFGRPLDTLPYFWDQTYQPIREHFFGFAWNEVYDFIEFMAQDYKFRHETEFIGFTEHCNEIFKTELSAFRFVSGQITQITSEEEIASIEEAQNNCSTIKPISVHLTTALNLLSDRQSPNYRNSIKESISAVEALGILITGSKGTLGALLKPIESKVALHPALKEAFSKFYGYTSDANGIRHALMDEPNVDFEDAKFMLVSCSAFINYLLAKSAKAGIKL